MTGSTDRVKWLLVGEAYVDGGDGCRASVSVDEVATVSVDVGIDGVVVNSLQLAAIRSHVRKECSAGEEE